MTRIESRHAFSLVNGRDAHDRALSVRVENGRIAALDAPAQAHDRVLDLQGDRILPGLINAHDHLQLNHFPPLEYSARFRNARDWIENVVERKRLDPAMRAAAAIPLDERLYFGGIKNLLAGVTTVAHHDPLFSSLQRDDFPTHVAQHFRWSHSLFIDGAEQVRQAHAATPVDLPWIVHAAEGVDAEAAAEIQRLHALGCLTPNAVLVHALANEAAHRDVLVRGGASVVWCPSSNLRLFGRTAKFDDLIALGRVALGTDSRLSGARDLLAELRIAEDISGLDTMTLESLVTTAAARVLRVADRGALAAGALADLLILPRTVSLTRATRADVRLVIKAGHALYGDIAQVDSLEPDAWSRVRVDTRTKALRSSIVARLLTSSLREPGLELPSAAWKAA